MICVIDKKSCRGMNFWTWRTEKWCWKMEKVPGAMGTSASLALRLGQAIFSTASLLFMCLGIDFYSYTAFWYCLILFSCTLIENISFSDLSSIPISIFYLFSFLFVLLSAIWCCRIFSLINCSVLCCIFLLFFLLITG